MYDKFLNKDKTDLKSENSNPSSGTYVTDNQEVTNPLLPKKLSFNSCTSSTETPEKRLDTASNSNLETVSQLQSANAIDLKKFNSNGYSSNDTSRLNAYKTSPQIKKKPIESSLAISENFKKLDTRDSDPHPRTIQYVGPDPAHSRELIMKRISYLKQKKLKLKK